MEPLSRPPIAAAPLSAVLIAGEEGADFDDSVRGWATVLRELGPPFEIILVDDSSTDGSGARADLLAGEIPQLRVLHQSGRRGLGAALRAGIAAAQYPLLADCRADKQYLPADLKRLLERIDPVDLVIGYRVGQPMPSWRRWLGMLHRGLARALFGLCLERSDGWLGARGRGRRQLARWIFGVPVRDPECLFALFRRAVFERIPIQTDGDFAPIEILAKANFLSCLITEVPVTWIPPRAEPPPSGKELRRQERREIWRLFRQPEFGPPAQAPTGMVAAPQPAAADAGQLPPP